MQSITARSRLFAAILIVAACAVGCASNPISVAETPLQKAYAIEASYNIVLEQAVEVARAQPALRDRIQTIEARTTPIIDQLGERIVDYTVERAKLNAEQTTAERVAVVAANLEAWIGQAETALVDLAAVLE